MTNTTYESPEDRTLKFYREQQEAVNQEIEELRRMGITLDNLAELDVVLNLEGIWEGLP